VSDQAVVARHSRRVGRDSRRDGRVRAQARAVRVVCRRRSGGSRRRSAGRADDPRRRRAEVAAVEARPYFSDAADRRAASVLDPAGARTTRVVSQGLRRRAGRTGEGGVTTLRVPASATTLTTAADALHGEEIDRTRAFVRLGSLVALGAAAAALAVPGDPR